MEDLTGGSDGGYEEFVCEAVRTTFAGTTGHVIAKHSFSAREEVLVSQAVHRPVMRGEVPAAPAVRVDHVHEFSVVPAQSRVVLYLTIIEGPVRVCTEQRTGRVEARDPVQHEVFGDFLVCGASEAADVSTETVAHAVELGFKPKEYESEPKGVQELGYTHSHVPGVGRGLRVI